ncbi:MAG: nucleoside deaminase [Actinomycetales bacterium]
MTATGSDEAPAVVDGVDGAGTDAEWLGQAVALAARNVAEGGGPFGALVVIDDHLVSTGVNRVTRDMDPTAHAEVTAIRAACRFRGEFHIPKAVLYTSCEPCPLCMASALWARVSRVVYAADREDAARGGFDDREFYELFARDRSTWTTKVEEIRLDDAAAPFEAWLSKVDRIAY